MHYDHPTSAPLGTLSEMRARIDELDERIIHLLMERIRVAQCLYPAKMEIGDSLYSPVRVHNLFKRLGKMAKFPLTEEAIMAIYREIISASILAQKRLVVGFAGCDTSLCAQAAKQCFGNSLRYRAFASSTELLQQTRKHTIDYAIVPDSPEGLEAIFDASRDGLDLFVFEQVRLSPHERFWVVGHQMLKYEPSASFASLIAVIVPNIPGAWQRVLVPFAQNDIDLIKLVTFEGPSNSESTRLYVECSGHLDHAAVKVILADLEASNVTLYPFGSYVYESQL